MRADCVCLDVNPAALASLRHHLSIGWLPGVVGGTARQFGDQIDGNERIVIVDEDDPSPRARFGNGVAGQHKLEPAEVKRLGETPNGAVSECRYRAFG